MAEDERTDARDFEDKTPTMKEQILSLYFSDMQDGQDLAMLTGASTSYVGLVLQDGRL